MPLSKRKNKERMRQSRATQVQPKPVHLVQPKSKENVQPNDVTSPSVVQPNTTKQEKLTMLRAIISNPEAPQSTASLVEPPPSSRPPLYNKRIHKQGDKVRMPGSNIEVTVPELDGDGNPVW